MSCTVQHVPWRRNTRILCDWAFRESSTKMWIYICIVEHNLNAYTCLHVSSNRVVHVNRSDYMLSYVVIVMSESYTLFCLNMYLRFRTFISAGTLYPLIDKYILASYCISVCNLKSMLFMITQAHTQYIHIFHCPNCVILFLLFQGFYRRMPL